MAAPTRKKASKERAPARLALSLQFADASHRAVLTRPRVSRWLLGATASRVHVAVRIVGSEEGRTLNREFRGQDHATNVLTFPYEYTPVIVADIVLCAPVIEREATELGIPLETHYAHLVVHGALHAQAFDHENRFDAAVMQARESAIVVALGYPDPYKRPAPP